MVHRLSRFLSYKNCTTYHKAYLSAISSQDEPKHFFQAVKNPQWRDDMQKEIISIESNNTRPRQHCLL